MTISNDQDEFPDEDFTAEEFDACLSQVTSQTTADVQFKAPAAVRTTTSTNFSLDGEVQLLRQRVARLSRELHGERLTKQDELKGQAEAYKKQIRELRTQLEFKEHEVTSARAVTAKLSTEHGVTVHNSPAKVQVVDASNDVPQFPLVPQQDYWDQPAFAVNPEPNCSPTFFDIIRSYVSSSKSSDKSVEAPPLDAVVLALQSVGALIEAQTCSETSLLKQLCTDATSKGEMFFFSVIVDTLRGNPSKSKVISEALGLVEIIAAASDEAAGLIVGCLRRDVLLQLVAGSFGERIVERAIWLIRVALEHHDAEPCAELFVHSDDESCLWRAVANYLDGDRALPTVCEAAILAQRGSEKRDSCECFHDLVDKLMERFRKSVKTNDPSSSRSAIVLLNCFCAIADANPRYQLHVCRLVALCTDVPDCEAAVRDVTRVWDFTMDDREIYIGCSSGQSSQGF